MALFITFEGPEGAGKTTQIHRLADRLATKGHDVLLTREPGGTAAGEALRSLLLDPDMSWTALSEALLMNAARDAHLQDKILPALEAGKTVLCDRFSLSTRAYQGGGGGLDDTWLRALEEAVCVRRPDITLVFDLPPTEGMARADQRGTRDRFESKPADYHEHVAARFLALARSEGHPIIDATGSPEDVEERIGAALLTHLPDVFAGSYE